MQDAGLERHGNPPSVGSRSGHSGSPLGLVVLPLLNQPEVERELVGQLPRELQELVTVLARYRLEPALVGKIEQTRHT